MVTLKGTMMSGKNNQGMVQALLKQRVFSSGEMPGENKKDNKFMSVLGEEDQEQ